MGLRIIDKSRTPTPEPSAAERDAGLAAAASHWARVKGLTNVDIQAHFIDNFRRAKARTCSPAQVAEMATRVTETIRKSRDESASPHGQVDVATLMVLL